METHSSVLAWKIPWTEEPGGLQAHGVTRVGHDLVTTPPPMKVKDKGIPLELPGHCPLALRSREPWSWLTGAFL